MIIYKTADKQSELEGILSLQKINLTESLTTAEVQSQGFVTVN
jgi:hypothetical protein